MQEACEIRDAHGEGAKTLSTLEGDDPSRLAEAVASSGRLNPHDSPGSTPSSS
jgi:hypothetical protein